MTLIFTYIMFLVIKFIGSVRLAGWPAYAHCFALYLQCFLSCAGSSHSPNGWLTQQPNTYIVCFDDMLRIVEVIIISMHKITERLTQCSNGSSSQTLCKRGAYALFCLWMHPPFREVW